MLHTLRKKGVTKTIDDQIKILSPLEKTVILCCNGFQTTDTHDALPMSVSAPHIKKIIPFVKSFLYFCLKRAIRKAIEKNYLNKELKTRFKNIALRDIRLSFPVILFPVL